MLQCVAVYCVHTLQCIVLHTIAAARAASCNGMIVLQYVAVCCSMLQCVDLHTIAAALAASANDIVVQIHREICTFTSSFLSPYNIGLSLQTSPII